jgi:hypothetical protein
LIESLISALISGRVPPRVVARYLLANLPNTYPAEVLLNASQARISAVDHPAFCGRGD